MSDRVGGGTPNVLRAVGGLGVSIRVTDGADREVDSGLEELSLPVADGLYAVQWTAGGSQSETVVRVTGGGETLVRPPWAVEVPDLSSSLSQLRAAAQAGFDGHPHGMKSSSGASGSGRPDRSALIVEVSDLEGDAVHDVASSVSLLDADGNEVDRLDGGGVSNLPVDLLTWSGVTPGRYRLRFAAASTEVLDLTVPVLSDRVTVVRMPVARATVLVHGSEGFTSVRSRGVDPGRAVVFTIPSGGPEITLSEDARLAETLLRDLALGTTSLSAGFLQVLADPRTDPLLKVYSALVALNRMELELSPALDVDWSKGEAPRRRQVEEWCRRAAEWVSPARRTGMPPDATAALWQIDRLRGGRIKIGPGAPPGSIRMPPMLECAWRWAVARTTIDRHALQDFASIRAAAKSAGGTTPWLCWNGAAAKGMQNPAPPATDAQLVGLMELVADRARSLRSRTRSPRSELVLPTHLPADVAATVQRVEQILDPKRGELRRHERDSPPAALAISLSLPVAALGPRLTGTADELARALEAEPATARRGPIMDAPGWTKEVKYKNDANRGRFGGRAERDGFRIEADFSVIKSRNWATIYLTVFGPEGFDGVVVIYLHSSFRPPRYELRFKDGVAKDKLKAWGGFTVGAWIPSRGVELELDLARVSAAPKIIRER